MAAAPIISMIVAIGGTAYSIDKQNEAARQQERAAAQAEQIGRENAAVIEAETAEQARRQELANKKTSGKAKAIAASSGVTTSGSVNTFLTDLDTAQTESLSWLVQSGANRSRIAELTGQYTAASGRAGAASTRAGAVGTAVQGAGTVTDIGNSQNWWQ